MLGSAIPSGGAMQPQAARNGQVFEHKKLTRKEAQLLGILRLNEGRCLSRGYLLETIWGYRGGTRTRTLDVHIQRLRRKLGPDGASHILTVFRNGYSWRRDDEPPGL
ncbi:MAG TPA: helix-turn-helix domain-containing protein [Bryobacteraceae bacterium]|nr:helix-turn-helix domain-containing protein [Bryobacteraceae bacterium]